MHDMVARLMMLVALLPFAAASQESSLPGVLYFDPTWCPRPDEVARLSRFMNIRRNGCCIQEALVFVEYRQRPELIAPWRHRLARSPAFAAECTGKVLTEQEEQLQQTEEYKRELTEEAREAARQQEIERQNAAELAAYERRLAAERAVAPKTLAKLDRTSFCVAFGTALRDNHVRGIGTYPELAALVRAEASRRKLTFDLRMTLIPCAHQGSSAPCG
jgi:hypothetical protein